MTSSNDNIVSSYTYSNANGKKSFSYKSQDSGEEYTIPAENIIGIIPSPASSNEEDNERHTILYVSRASSTSPDGPPESTTTLQTLTLPEPPTQDLLSDHALPSDSHLAHLYNQEHDPTIHPRDKDTLRILISTGSGTHSAQTYYRNLLGPLLAQLGLTRAAKIHTTTSADSIQAVTQHNILPTAQSGRAQTLVLLSGDGGVVDLVNALLGPAGASEPDFAKPTIVLLPLGTGNALAHSSGVTGVFPATLGLRTLLHGRGKGLPLFKARFSGARFVEPGSRMEEAGPGAVESYEPMTVHGAVVASWALHAALVADSDTAEYRKHGAERFKMAAMDNLYPADGGPTHSYKGAVSLKRRVGSGQAGGSWERIPTESYAYVLLTTCQYLEASFRISPASTPLDGILHVVHLGMPPQTTTQEGERAGDKVMAVMGAAYDGGKHVDIEAVGYEAVEGMQIEFEEEEARWRRVCIDGSIYSVEKGGSVEVERAEEVVCDFVVVNSGDQGER